MINSAKMALIVNLAVIELDLRLVPLANVHVKFYNNTYTFRLIVN